MSQNRLSRHFRDHNCKCCRLRRKMARLKRACEQIETIAGGPVEFFLPSWQAFASGQRRHVELMLTWESDRASVRDDLRQYTINQLRRLSIDLAGAIERLEVQP